MKEHDFGEITPEHRVKCQRCGFEQYSAAPMPLIGCVVDSELELRAGFVEDEISFVMHRLKKHQERIEQLWRRELIEA